MEPAQANRIRDLLVAQREELVSEGDLNVSPGKDGRESLKPDDDAKPLEEMNQVIASNRNRARAKRLQEIEAALHRLDEDPEDFGLCEGCEEPIKARRLELMPWTTLCIDCQSARETDKTSGRRKHLTDYK